MKNYLNWATPENAQRPNNFTDENQILMQVNVLDVMNNGESDFKLDPYDITGGENAIGNRLAHAREYFKEGHPMDYSEVHYSKYRKSIGFDNGRHRAIAAFHLGHEYVPMFVYKDGLDEFKKLVRTKPIEENKTLSIEEFIKNRNPKNFTREELHNYVINTFNSVEHKNHGEIHGLNQVSIKLGYSESENFLSDQYRKDNEQYNDMELIVDTDVFQKLLGKDLDIGEDDLNKVSVSYGT